jgi:hypothetical protein
VRNTDPTKNPGINTNAREWNMLHNNRVYSEHIISDKIYITHSFPILTTLISDVIRQRTQLKLYLFELEFGFIVVYCHMQQVLSNIVTTTHIGGGGFD